MHVLLPISLRIGVALPLLLSQWDDVFILLPHCEPHHLCNRVPFSLALTLSYGHFVVFFVRVLLGLHHGLSQRLVLRNLNRIAEWHCVALLFSDAQPLALILVLPHKQRNYFN